MRTSEKIAVLVFLAFWGAVYVWAGSVLIRGAARRILRQAGTASRGRKALHGVILSLAGLGLACGLYARLVEPYWLEVTHVRVPTPKLPAGARPIRIVHISDLHCRKQLHLEDRLVEVIAAQRPDAIVFTGDAVTDPGGLENFKRCMARLAGIAPAFGVLGNWDAHFPKLDFFGGTGVRQLKGQAVRLEIGGSPIWVAGADFNQESPVTALETADPKEFTVLLYHMPDAIGDCRLDGADLFGAGHTHGGQVALPFVGALVTFTRHGYQRGAYRLGPTLMYVNRGIGMEGGLAPRVRFLARPEVTVFEITPRD